MMHLYLRAKRWHSYLLFTLIILLVCLMLSENNLSEFKTIVRHLNTDDNIDWNNQFPDPEKNSIYNGHGDWKLLTNNGNFTHTKDSLPSGVDTLNTKQDLNQHVKLNTSITVAKDDAVSKMDKYIRQSENRSILNNVGSIVYDEGRLLRRIKEIHDSRYRPSINETCVSRMPQCIILGMRKCGTQELIDFLSLHPNIVRRGKPVYEINCFLSDDSLKNCKERPKCMPCSYSDQITISKSSIYFTTPSVAERLYKYNKNLKMILLVREPVERLIADYSFEFFQRKSRNGEKKYQNTSSVYEMMDPLDKRLINRLTGRIIPSKPEVVRSTYDEPMRRYLKYFNLEQILIIESNELKNRPLNVVRKVESFLGLKQKIKERDFIFNNDKGFYCINNDNHMNCYGDNRGRSKKSVSMISSKAKRKLKVFFKKRNENFFRLIGRKYDW